MTINRLSLDVLAQVLYFSGSFNAEPVSRKFRAAMEETCKCLVNGSCFRVFSGITTVTSVNSFSKGYNGLVRHLVQIVGKAVEQEIGKGSRLVLQEHPFLVMRVAQEVLDRKLLIFFQAVFPKQYIEILSFLKGEGDLKPSLERKAHAVRNFLMWNQDGFLRTIEEITIESDEITEVPEEIRLCSNLRTLRIENCEKLRWISPAIGNLKKLEKLTVSECKLFEKLPHSIGDLEALKYLDVSENPRLICFPESIGSLTNLEELYMSGCTGLRTLPCSIENLTGLRWLDISYCSFEFLPDSIKNLTAEIDLAG